jgi:hypothetical protein
MALGNLEWGFEQKGTKVTKTEGGAVDRMARDEMAAWDQ